MKLMIADSDSVHTYRRRGRREGWRARGQSAQWARRASSPPLLVGPNQMALTNH